MKIRLKLTLAFLAIAMMVAVVGYFAAASSQKILEKTIGNNFTILVADVLADIDRRIDARMETFQEEIRNPYIIQAVSASNKAFENMQDSQAWIHEKDSQWVSVPKAQITPFMHELIDNGVSNYLRENTKFYRDKYDYDVFSEVFVTNKYGANIAQNQKTSDYYQADEEWWQKTKENGMYVSDLEYDDSSDIYSIAVGLRIEGQNGEFLGVIKVVLNIEEISVFLDKAKQSQGQYNTFQLKLLTKDAKVIYSTQGNKDSLPLPANLADSLKDKKNHYSIMEHSSAGSQEPPAGTTLFAFAHSKGFREFEGLGWTLIAEVDTDEIFVPVVQMKVHILIIALAITILSVILGLFVSHTIAHPIQKLTAAVSRVNRNNLNIALDVKSSGEVGQLAETFNTIISDLKATTSSIDELNQQIGERKEAEAKVERQNRFLNSILESLTHPFYVIDTADYRVKLANSAANAENRLLENATCYNLSHGRNMPCDETDHVCPLREVRKTKKAVVVEHIHCDKEGQPLYVEVHAYPVFDDEGNVSQIIEYSLDITNRKIAEEKLLKLLSLHDATLEATADGILVIDLDGKIVTHNQKFLKMWHIPAEMVTSGDNETLLVYVCGQLKNPSAFLDVARRFHSRPEDEAFDILEFNDGRVFERFSKPQMIYGKIVGYVRSFRDITERVKAEETLKQTCTQLEKVNRDLVEMQAQSIQNEKMAAIGQLAAGVAHEINNPVGFVSSNFETLENYGAVFLRLISTYDELVKEIQKSTHTEWAAKGQAIDKVRDDLKIDFITDDIHALFDDSREGLDRITKIIQSLRDFSRIDQVSDFCEYDLNDGIQSSLVVARNQIKNDCEIQTELSEIPPVPCNPGQINQVILNIIVNAAQAIKSQNRGESGKIVIQTLKSDQHIICRITDDGPGIPPEIMTKIFDPFFTTKPVGAGTGLGLSISRDIIVNKHKGELLVDSTIGKGTTFTIKMPLQVEFSQTEKDVTI
jgi:two-component system NtrC family sensor kinase